MNIIFLFCSLSFLAVIPNQTIKKAQNPIVNLDSIFLYSKIQKEILDDELAHAARLGLSHELYLKVMKVPTPEEKQIQYTKFCKNTFKLGYEKGNMGYLYLDEAINILSKISSHSTLYPKSKKLIAFYKIKIQKKLNEVEIESKKTSLVKTNCVDPKYGCYGSENCHRCTDCSRCRHCNDHNGSCGVCR
jgi:hypothetical protein